MPMRDTVRLKAVLVAASRGLGRLGMPAINSRPTTALCVSDSHNWVAGCDASMAVSLPRVRAVAAMVAACLPLLAACSGARIEAAPRVDRRTPIQLSVAEDEHLRSGMRAYLESIEGIVEALPRNKMAAVASHSKRAGMGMVEDVPVSAVMKLPPEFVMLSMDTHQKFEALSRVAEESGTKSAVLTQLGEILANCTACHSTYRISPERR